MKLKKLEIGILTVSYIIGFVFLPVADLVDKIKHGETISLENLAISIVISVIISVLFMILPRRTVVLKQVPDYLLGGKNVNITTSPMKNVGKIRLLVKTLVEELNVYIILIIMYLIFVISPIFILDASASIFFDLINIHLMLSGQGMMKAVVFQMLALSGLLFVFAYVFAKYSAIFKLPAYLEGLSYNMSQEDRKEFIKNNFETYFISYIISIMSTAVIVFDIFDTTLNSVMYGLLKLSVALLILAITVVKDDYEHPLVLIIKFIETGKKRK